MRTRRCTGQTSGLLIPTDAAGGRPVRAASPGPVCDTQHINIRATAILFHKCICLTIDKYAVVVTIASVYLNAMHDITSSRCNCARWFCAAVSASKACITYLFLYFVARQIVNLNKRRKIGAWKLSVRFSDVLLFLRIYSPLSWCKGFSTTLPK